MKKAILSGYTMSRSGSGQPTLVETPGENTGGVLVTDLDDAVIERLDGFYGPNYTKRKLSVLLDGNNVDAHVYILKNRPVIAEGIIDYSTKK
jgi:hypothetical protein